MKELGIVIFGCLTKPKYREQIEDCYNTWVKDALENNCIVRFYVGDIPEDINPKIKEICVDLKQGDDYISATYKQWHGFEHIVENEESCKFYFTCGTDTFLNIKNALKEIKEFDHNQKLYIGGGYGEEPVEEIKYKYFSGGGGVFLSHVALKIILEKIPDFLPWWMYAGNSVIIFTDENGVKMKKCILGSSDLQIGILCHQNNIEFISLGHLKIVGDGTHNREGVDKNTLVSCHLMKHNDFYNYHEYLKTT